MLRMTLADVTGSSYPMLGPSFNDDTHALNWTGLIVSLLAILLMILLAPLLSDRRKKIDALLDRIHEYMRHSSWDRVTSIPSAATGNYWSTPWLIRVSSHGHLCAYSCSMNSATIFLGVTGEGGGRLYERGNLMLATADLRSPMECLLTSVEVQAMPATEHQILIFDQGGNMPLKVVVHFKYTEPRPRLKIEITLRIIELIFSEASELLTKDAVITLGPSGLLYQGVNLHHAKDVELALEPIVRVAPKLLVNCQAIWQLNS